MDSKKLSSGSFETLGLHGAIAITTSRAQRPFSRKTVLAPTKSKSTPPKAGPAMAEMFSCNPLKTEADGRASLETISGTAAENAGALIAKPVPIISTEARMTKARRGLNKHKLARPPEQMAIQM